MTPSAAPRQRRRPSILLAVAFGLGSGWLLSAPLARFLRGEAIGPASPMVNPFSRWAGIASQDVVVLGTDVGGGNTDVMTVLRVRDGVTEVLQVPRDTYIESRRFGPLKANALYSLGGPEAVKQELSLHLGRPVQHHVLINLAAIRRMADAIGGIVVDVPKRMAYTDRSQGLFIDLQPGPQLLKGRDLEGFLRFRHDELGDIGRLERQKLAIQALVKKLSQPQELVKLPVLLSAAGKDLRTDLGPMEIGGLVTAMSGTRLQTHRLEGRPFYRHGISYWEAVWPPPEPLDAAAADGAGPPPGARSGGASGGTGSRDGRYQFLF
ncbi:MAG: LCP family protein [Cyanobacteriota bacterium]